MRLFLELICRPLAKDPWFFKTKRADQAFVLLQWREPRKGRGKTCVFQKLFL
jgi:hypothetical protein